jgi:hypothetical protein
MAGNGDVDTKSSGSSKAVATQNDGPPTDRWVVKLSHPLDHSKQVFSSVSEKRARRFVQNRYPRGSEAYLVGPDGTTESYEAERTGPYGEDAEQWAEFDPASYRPPEEAPPPGESAWGDVEG